MPLDQVHVDSSMSVSNKLQTITTTTAIIDSAISNLEVSSYSVVSRQVDNTLDPTGSVSGDKYLITSSSSLHAGFGVIAGIEDDDIVKYNGSAYIIDFNASLRGEGSICTVRAENRIDYYTGSAWQDIKELMALHLVDNTADLDKPVSTAVAAAISNAVAGLYDNKGSYDASTNTPDLDTSPSGIKNGDAYTVSVAGTFYTEGVEVGDVLISSQDNPTLLAHWAKVNKNISFGTTAGTACEGNDSRLTPQASSDVVFTPDGDIAATDVQAAIVEVRDEADTKIAGKEDSLGFTAEDSANKDTDVALTANSDTKYASQKAVKTYIDTVDALKAPLASPSFTGTSTFTGLVDISGASAGQLKFPATQNPSADVNTLDDYEEGTWDAEVWDDSDSGSELQTYTNQTLSYQKVGSIVHIYGYFLVSSLGTLTTTQFMKIGGLPFTSNSGTYVYGSINIAFGGNLIMTAGTKIEGHIAPSSSSMSVYSQGYYYSNNALACRLPVFFFVFIIKLIQRFLINYAV